jgi:hypothetical protein
MATVVTFLPLPHILLLLPDEALHLQLNLVSLSSYFESFSAEV